MVSIVKTDRQKLKDRFFSENSLTIENSGKTYNAFDNNLSKNAFNNIRVPDHSRVILKNRRKILKKTDYINANWVCGNKFIATQRPITDTIVDFYHMCIENGVKIIVSLTKKINYLPYYNVAKKYGDMTITNTEEIVTTNIIIRKLKICHKDNTYNITHIHFLAWTDFGTPRDEDFRNLVRIVKKYDHHIKTPIVVHCRAGVGRAGVFITVYGNLRYGIRGKTIDIEETIEQLRRDRDGMIQTLDQAEFAYNIFLKLIQKKPQTSVPSILSQATDCLKIIELNYDVESEEEMPNL